MQQEMVTPRGRLWGREKLLKRCDIPPIRKFVQTAREGKVTLRPKIVDTWEEPPVGAPSPATSC